MSNNAITPDQLLDEAFEIYRDVQKFLMDHHSTKSVAAFGLATAMLDCSSLNMLVATLGKEEAEKLFHSFSLAAPLAVQELDAKSIESTVPIKDDIVH